MSRRSGSEARVRKHALVTRWSPEELARLREIAHHSGCSTAEVLRQLVARDHRNIIPSRELNATVRRLGHELRHVSSPTNVDSVILNDALSQIYAEMLRALIEMRR
jgi:hypothetical protein